MKLVFLLLLAPLAPAGEFWQERKAAAWTAAEREQFLQQSPWAKTVKTGVDVTKSAVRSTLGQLSGGSPGALPQMRAVIRWESATPVREAVGKPLPDAAEGYLVISVTMTGMLSAPETDEEQLRTTSLQAKGQAPVNPALMLRDDRLGILYFLFANPAGITGGESDLTFETNLGSMDLKARFLTREMRYLGKPAKS